MEYMLDVASPKVQRAMKALSITNEDLKIRTPSSFHSPGISVHIQKLRYKHYTAKSASLANKVVNYLKKPGYSTPSKTSALCQYKSAFREVHNEKFKKNYEKGLKTFYEFEKQTRKSEVETRQRVDRDQAIGNRLKEFVQNQREKLESRFLRNKENLKSVEMERDRKTEEIIERINRTRKSQSVRQSHEKNARMKFSFKDSDDIDQKLNQINRKLVKSSENYQKYIKEKVQRLKIRDNKKRAKSQSDNYEDLVRYIKDKQDGAESRRMKIKQEHIQKTSEKDTSFNQKIQRIRGSSDHGERFKDIMNKEKRVEDFLIKVKLKLRDNIEYKQEKSRLFHDYVSENLNRQKRVLNMKKEKIIEKHLELVERQKEQNEYLEKTNRKIREKAMNFTVKKEKMHEIKSRISKSQTPEKIKKFLQTI